MEIRRLATFDGPEAERWYDSWHDGTTAGLRAPLVMGREAQLGSLAQNQTNPNRHREAWGSWDHDECLGTMLIEWSIQENLHRADIGIAVPPRHRGRGVGTALWKAASEQARQAGRNTVVAEVAVPREQRLEDWPGGRFALARGFTSGLAEDRLVLDLPVPPSIMENHDRPAPGYRALTWHGLIPADWLPAMAALMNEMEADVPTGELDVEAARWDAERLGANQDRMAGMGWGMINTLVVGSDDEPAGYTKLFIEGHNVYQDDTYVRRTHRGHRLGAFAKARNLRALAERHPRIQHVHAWTAADNAAMQTINARFGFHPVETTHSMEARL